MIRQSPVSAIRRFSTQPTIDRINQTIRLPDGRTLGFAEYGAHNGRPLIYFHGYPSSRIEAKPIDKYASRHGIRVLALDRPGYGLSSPQPERTMLDWTKDVESFADAMDIKKFAILGTSGGGPFAAACAYALPRQRLTSVGLFASGPPWAAGKQYMTRTRRMACFLAHKAPFILKLILDGVLAFGRWLTSRTFVTKRIHTWLEAVNAKLAADAKDASKPFERDETPVAQQREYLVDLILGEPFRQGTGAMTRETKLLSAQDWGFPLEDTTYPIQIWHGTKDVNAPIEAIRYLAEKMPNAKLTEFAQDTHYTMGTKMDQVVEELMATDNSELK
ncbi:hypothetical protein VHEMI07150 [[Torrubiella] hemipterigena]|uniref:AB hydrolase-1 domain-containing protein n=1 Tax=[Torrubiella] hemipterigena TaxID=1531966 RepID=A0A0A1TKT8_9HYPO|nr:hypothetical protein VHEMI07150 [[Torrubiella] hemipterigena]